MSLTTPGRELDALGHTIYADGFAPLPGAFSRAWAQALREDFDVLFAEARAYRGGTVSRGRHRYYFAVQPERLRGFAELVTHPVITGLSEHVLGPDYEIVEVAFDVPLPGAIHQPWHRDFPMPPETREEGRLSSLAFNVSGADVTDAMGPFEIAPGTQFDDDAAFAHGMFPDPALWGRYAALGRRRRPQLGDASVRTGLAVHRGTPNRSREARPVLVLGVVEPGVETEDAHVLEFTPAAWEALPEPARRHLRATVVEELVPVRQRHTIEGLVMGE